MAVRHEKSAYDPVDLKVDGVRIVATRFWPRGLGKAARDLYLPDLAPSAELLRSYLDEGIDWQTFRRRYTAEMEGQRSLIRTLHWLSEKGETLTVMCTCEKPERCHRSLLAKLIAKGN